MDASAVVVVALFGVIVPAFLLVRGVRALRLARHLSDTAKRPVRDGVAALRGRLRAVAEPARAPFTDRAAVSCRYTVGHRTLDGDATMAGYKVEAQGFVQVPSVLETPFGEVAIRAGLHAPGEDERFDPAADAVVAERMRALLTGGRLQPANRPTPPITADAALLDAPDGALRFEVTTEWIQPADAAIVRRVTEGVVADGAETIVIGTYRASDRAITAIAELLPPDPAQARGMLRRRAYVGFAVGLACALAGAVVTVMNLAS